MKTALAKPDERRNTITTEQTMTPTIPKRNSPMRGQYVTELVGAASVMTDQFFGVTWPEIVERNRDSTISRARRWASWWLHKQGLSAREIGRLIGRSNKSIEPMIALARWEDDHGMMNSRAITEIAEREIGDWRRAYARRRANLS